ncbi:VC0807 family protein [Dactylosporangium sp. NPDC005572]|uniref:VC0807 family protein n=1 Tax=Dactylosporangium sp. NPDC005572 TaxID=3156889 RepID=UPI00339F1F38
MGRFGKVLLGWGPTLVANVVLPLLTYSWLTDRGLTEASALALSGVWPAVEVAVMFAVRRRVDEFGVLTLIIIALGVGSSLALRDGRLVLFKESAVTGLFGVLLLASLLAARPLMFYFGRRFATDGSPERVAWWDGLWQYAGFRRTQRILTVVWGVTFLAEAALRIELTEVLSIDTMVVINAVLPYAVTAALVTWTILYSRQARRRAPAAAVAAA